MTAALIVLFVSSQLATVILVLKCLSLTSERNMFRESRDRWKAIVDEMGPASDERQRVLDGLLNDVVRGQVEKGRDAWS